MWQETERWQKHTNTNTTCLVFLVVKEKHSRILERKQLDTSPFNEQQTLIYS